MPDVGILNLQIHDNSEQAVQGLKQVAGALQSIKEAVNGAKIGTVATQLKRIATVVNESMNDSVINRIERFCTAMSKLNGLGNININMRGADRIAQTMESIENGRQAMEQVRETASEFTNSINTGFDQVASRIEQATTGTETFYHSMERTNELVSNMGWSAKATADQFAEMFKAWSEMRSAMSLGPGEKHGLLGDGSGGSGAPWTYWKDGAIEVEGTVTEAMDNIDRHLEGVQARLYGMSDVQDMGMGQVFYSLEDAARVLGISVEEAQRRIDDLRQSSEAIGETPRSFASIEEAAQAMGISVEDARRRVVQMRDTIETNIGGSSAGMAEAFDETAQEADLVRQRIVLLTDRIQQMRNTLAEGINIFHWDESQITKALLQINALERQLDGLQHKVNMENMAVDYGEEMVENLAGYYNEIDLMTEKLEGMKRALAEDINMNRVDNDAIASRVIQIQHLSDKIDDLRAKQEAASRGFSFNNLNVDYGNEMVDDLVNNYSQIDLMQIKLDGMKQALAEDINMNRVDTQAIAERTMQIQRQAEKIEDLKRKQEETTSGTHRFKDACDAAKKGLKDMFPFLERVRSQFGRIVLRRAIMAILKSITSGFKEGVENVYRYSQAVGTSFAPAMDTAASKLLQMKNSIGAAVAPMLEALIPVLRQVVDWFIGVVNYANQFFALMTGQKTWTRALETGAKAYDDVKESAKGASKATKDLLADWDELNIIQSASGGSGSGISGKVTPNYSEMFEQVSDFDEGLKKTIEFIKENFDSILATAGLIGAAILGWKINSAFNGVLGTLGTLGGTVISVALSLILTDAFGKAYIKTGDPGWFIADALTGAVGAGIAGKIASKLVGTSGGIVTAGFTLVLEGAINLDNAVSAMTELQESQAWALTSLGAIETGLGAGLAAYGLGAGLGASVLLGGTVTAATFMIMIPILMKAKEEAEYREMARKAFVDAGSGGISIEKFVEELQAVVDEKTAGAKKVIEVSVSIKAKNAELGDSVKNIARMHELIRPGKGLTEEEAQEFKKAWGVVIGTFTDLQNLHFDVIYQGLEEVITNGSKEIREAAIGYRKAMIEAEGIMHGAEGKMKARMDYLTDMVMTGNASPAEMAEYENLYSYMHPVDTKTQSALDSYYASTVNGFKLPEEDPVGAVMDLIGVLSGKTEGPVKEAMDTYKEALDTELESIAAKRQELDMMYANGFINDDQYRMLTETFDNLETLFRDRYEEQIAGIANMSYEAYESIMEQALAGLRDESILSDSKAMKMYFTEIFDPIMTALEEAGYEIPEWYKNIREGIKNGTIALNSDLTTFDNQISRHDLFSMIFDLYDNPIPIAIAFELDRDKTRLEPMSDSEKTDIVRNLLEASGFDVEVISQLSEAFGWSTLDILKRVDFSRATADQLDTFVSDMLYGTSYGDLIDDVVTRMRNLDRQPLGDSGANAIVAPGRGRFVDPSRVMGFNGYSSGVNFVPSSTMGANETVETEDKAMVDAQNRQIAQITNVLVPLLQQILQKPLTVNLAPSSDWGQFNDRSYDRFSKVNGNP